MLFPFLFLVYRYHISSNKYPSFQGRHFFKTQTTHTPKHLKNIRQKCTLHILRATNKVLGAKSQEGCLLGEGHLLEEILYYKPVHAF